MKDMRGFVTGTGLCLAGIIGLVLLFVVSVIMGFGIHCGWYLLTHLITVAKGG